MLVRLKLLAVSLAVATCFVSERGTLNVSAEPFPTSILESHHRLQEEDSLLPASLISERMTKRPASETRIQPQNWTDLNDSPDDLNPFNSEEFLSSDLFDADGSSEDAKSGTAIESLPSFRGIKGIKNLPGGVGTLLLSYPQVGYMWYPKQNTDQSGTSLSMERYDVQGAVPVYNTGVDTWLLTADFDTTTIRTNAVIPTTSQKLPSHLYDISLGGNYYHAFESGKMAGLVFDVGSISDKPFESGRDIMASGTGFLIIPRNESSSWFLGIHASTNSQVLYGIPIPGGGIFYHPSDDFQAIAGFPFTLVNWKFAPDWQLQYVYAFVTTMHARTVYQPTPDWQMYGGFSWTNDNWDRAGRMVADDHLFYYEKKLSLGFLWWFRPHVGLEVAGGWAFDRYFTELNGFQIRGDKTIDIESGPFLSSEIDIRF